MDALAGVEHRTVHCNGVDLHLALLGEGPPVIFCHGFPGLWYSWRKQLPAVAEAGFRAIAFDQRGYGGSSRPRSFHEYSSDVLVDDLIGILDALGEPRAIFVGQDFGAPLVWTLAARHPDRVQAVAILGVPYDFESASGGDGEFGAGVEALPSQLYARVAQEHFFHMHYFQAIGPAERELGAQPREFLKRLYWALSARGNLLDLRGFQSAGTGYMDVLAEAPALPWPWLSVEDMDYLVAEYLQAGADLAFIGGLNNYRVADLNWEIGAAWRGREIHAPALFMMGECDPVADMLGDSAMKHMQALVPNLEAPVTVAGAGHFVMQENAAEVNAHLLPFLSRCRSSQSG